GVRGVKRGWGEFFTAAAPALEREGPAPAGPARSNPQPVQLRRRLRQLLLHRRRRPLRRQLAVAGAGQRVGEALEGFDRGVPGAPDLDRLKDDAAEPACAPAVGCRDGQLAAEPRRDVVRQLREGEDGFDCDVDHGYDSCALKIFPLAPPPLSVTARMRPLET